MIKYYTFLMLLTAGLLSAQVGKVGINTTSPQATLDIQIAAANVSGTTPEGLLIPRVSRSRALNMTSPALSTMVYVNTLDGTASGTVVNVSSTGFYFYDGSVWQPLRIPAVTIGAGNQYYTAAAGQTTYDLTTAPVANTVLGNVMVFRNGVKLVAGADYTFSGNRVTLTGGAAATGGSYTVAAGDIIEIQWIK